MMIRRPLSGAGEDKPTMVRPQASPQGTPAELDKLWADLISDDSRTAYNVTHCWRRCPRRRCRSCATHLKPASPLDPQHLALLVAHFFNDDPQVWQKAHRTAGPGRRAEVPLGASPRVPPGGARLTDLLASSARRRRPWKKCVRCGP